MSRHFPAGILGILVPVLLCIISLRLPEQSVKAQGGGTVVENEIMTYQEALTGTPGRMIPIPQPAGQVSLIDAGTADAIRGMENLLGPFLGNAPDAGAYELGLGVPWAGPRNFTNLLAYGLPQGWQVSPLGNLGSYTSLGAPSNVAANDFRLLLTRSNPQAFILVTFEQMQGDARWNRLDAILGGQGGDTELVKRVSFRDGLDGRIVRRGGNAQFLGGRVDDEGVLNVVAGVAAGNLAASAAEPGLKIQDDFYTFFRSLTYAWYLQDITNPISLNFVTSPAPGFVSVGSAATPSTGNAVVPGKLHGDVTITNASVIWDVEGDENLNATATVQFRRQGTTQWRDALDLSRILYTDTDQTPAETRNRLTGSIFRLSPGATYEAQVTLSDPDGGGETRTTTFATRQVPKPYQAGRTLEVWPTDDLGVVTATAQPGDTFLLHAGTYTGSQNRPGWMILNSGTRERPILFRAFGDGVVNFRSIGIINILVQGSYVWLDGFQIVNPISTEPGNRGIVMYSPSNSPRLTGVSVTRNTIRDSWMLIHPQHTNDSLISDNSLIGAGQDPNAPPWDPSDPSTHPMGHMLSSEGIEFEKGWTRGHVVAFNEITAVGDGVSYGGGNIDVHGNRIHETYDDSIEPDYSWDNYRVYGNLAWMTVETNFSFQPIKGGPWYIVQNQFTGTRHNPFKMEGGAAQYVVANTIVSSHWTQAANGLFRRGSVFSNNYWKALSLQGGLYNSLGRGPEPDPSVMLLWGHNRYDAHPCNIWDWWGSLENAQAKGAEKNTRLVNATGCTGGGGGGGGGGGNQAPTAHAQNVVARQNGSAAMQLTGSDPEGVKLTYAIVSGQGPSNGLLSALDSATGKVIYTPNQDFSGTDSFAFTVSDGTSVSAFAVVSIKVIVPVSVKKEGLAGHWKFDETSGGVAVDSSDRKNDGILKGGPARVAGRIGGALEFDGTDDYVNASSDVLNTSNPFTLSAWIRLAAAFLGDEGIIGEGVANNGSTLSGRLSSGQSIVALNMGSQSTLFSTTALSVNTWYHAAGTWDGTTARIYINGLEEANGARTGSNAVTPFEIGSYSDNAGGNFPGLIDDVCIFSRALSPGELLTLASGEPCSGAPPPGESVCLALSLKNRSREALQNFAVPTTVDIRKPDGTIALSTVATPERDGTLRITDTSLLGNLDATTSYTVSVKPRSHQRKMLRNITNIKDGICRSFLPSIVGDFNADGRITLPDLVRAIRQYQRNDDSTVSEAYGGVRNTLASLVDLLRNVLTRAGDDE